MNAVSLTSTSSIIASDAVYSRNSYDTKIRSGSDGCFLEMGGIGATDLLRIGAFNSVTNIDSISNRPIYFKQRTGDINSSAWTWIFSTSTSFNSQNVTYWSTSSDHRIKENIKKANIKICYDNVKNINLYRYNYIEGFKLGTRQDFTQLGFIAQQVKQHFPKSVTRGKTRLDDKREVPDLASVDVSQVNFSLFGAVKQLIRVVEKQSKRIKKLEEMLNIIDDDEVEDDADEPYTRINCEDECDIDEIEPSEPTEV